MLYLCRDFVAPNAATCFYATVMVIVFFESTLNKLGRQGNPEHLFCYSVIFMLLYIFTVSFG